MTVRDKQTVEPGSQHALYMAPSDMVIQRLVKLGLPGSYLERKEPGLMQCLKEGKISLQETVAILLPGSEDTHPSSTSFVAAGETKQKSQLKQQCREGLRWIQWLMFEGDPNVALERIRKLTGGQRGVCGAVWGSNDIAYRCRTCENDPTCAICVPCFLAGNHQNHDYLMIHTGGGCCDCGDGTAWKPSGFCSQHRGPGQVPSLEESFTKSAYPVLEALLIEWARKLQIAMKVADRKPKNWEDKTTEQKAASKLSAAMVEMLLHYCNCTESMLMFVASLVGSSKVGLLNSMLETEHFLPKKIIALLHELLFKLMADPSFKFQFAKVFIEHYPHFIHDDIHGELESTAITHASRRFKDNPTLSSFSVQIFTVPTLTPRLVSELGLLNMLFGAMKEILLNSAGDDGHIKVNKGPIANSLYYRVLEDIRYVMSHKEVAQYAARERLDLFKSWLCLIACTQGMDPQKRVTGFHVEEESESWFFTYCLEVQMAYIHHFFVDGAAMVSTSNCIEGNESQHSSLSKKKPDEDAFVERYAKLSHNSKGGDVVGVTGASSGIFDMETENRGGAMLYAGMEDAHATKTSVSAVGMDSSTLDLPTTLLQLVFESTKVLFTWLEIDSCAITAKSNKGKVRKEGQRRVKGRGIRGLFKDVRGPVAEESVTVEDKGSPEGGNTVREWLSRAFKISHGELRRAENMVNQSMVQRIATSVNAEDCYEMDIDMPVGRADQQYTVIRDNCELPSTASTEWWIGSDLTDRGMQFSFFSSKKDWPVVDYDVSRQELSVHIPLHRMLALLLKKSVSFFVANCGPMDNNVTGDMVSSRSFIKHLFPPAYRAPAFSAILMEHPLRIQVFCAQVRAGMWRRNGHYVLRLRDYYHSVRWCEDSLDLDLFLLQCCAVMSVPDDFVETIQTRFGLSDYFSPYPSGPNEYEPALVQEMLGLLIQIVSERNFCGFSIARALRRELIVRLAINDAPRSHLVKSLPPRLSDNQQLQQILDSVATYCNPSGMKQGKYSLRKECWEELDLYHPRWTAKELQYAEDRYMRACGTFAVLNQLPRWQKPFAPLQSLSTVATCRRVHDILRSVFSHAVFSEKLPESSAPESVVIVALHLLALALDICALDSHKDGINSQGSVLADSCSDPSSPMDVCEAPPLLIRSTERVRVGVAKGHSLLSLLVSLMRRYGPSNVQSATIEANQCNVGDLIRRLLVRFANIHQACMYEIESLAPELLHRVSSGLHSKAKDEQIQLSETEKRKALARQRQEAIMEKMKAAQEKFVASLQPVDEGNGSEKGVSNSNELKAKKTKDFRDSKKMFQDSVPVTCALCHDISSRNPASFLTLVQRSCLIAVAEKGIPSWDNGTQFQDEEGLPNKQRGTSSGVRSCDTVFDDSQNSIELWNLIQMVVDDDMGRGRPHVLEPLMDFVRADLLDNFEVAHTMPSVQVVDSSMSESAFSEAGSENSTAEHIIGNGRDSAAILQSVTTCYDQDYLDIGTRENALFAVLVEYLKTLPKVIKEQHHDDNKASSVRTAPQSRQASVIRTATQGGIETLPFQNIGSNDNIGVHISSCGHAVHQECLDRYLSSLLQRYLSRTLFEGLQIVDPQRGELLCPVCRRLANSVLPALQKRSDTVDSCAESVASSRLSQSGIPSLLEDGTSVLMLPCQLHHALYLLHKAEVIWYMKFSKTIPKSLPKSTRAVLSSLFSVLCELYFSVKEGIDKSIHGRSSQSLLLWDVLRYTIISAEVAARERKPEGNLFTSENRLDALWRAVDCSQGSILPLVLQVAKVTQDLNRQEVLFRVRGMQLFVGSICYGISQDSIVESFIPGNISKVLNLKDLTKQVDAPDLQFWCRAADPVLIHDPFSSLLWLVFCMPSSFLNSMECFISMVHLFYLVCLVQIIALIGTQMASDDQLSNTGQAFMQTLSSILKDSSLSLHSDENSLMLSPIMMFQRLTLPFLRRCALLKRLLFDDSSDQSFETGSSWKIQIPYRTRNISMISTDSKQASTDFFEELREHGELEKTLFLPPPQVFLEEKNCQELSLKWCQHLVTVKSSRTFQHISRPTFAAPFQLMRLPVLYQDLLQRYIKKQCPVCQTVPDQPALCLLCGALCCAYSRCSCCSTNRQTECYKHALTCGAGIGVFLLIRKTTILLQRYARQASWPSPYLDAFGEEDIDVTRGKPLYLSKERYADLTEMVVSHGLDHCSLVLNHTTRESIFWG